ncbi:hypothetical protein, partial [Acinetobacter sp. YH12057]|uniref:hypothetical protein n=1 Tax=Acinetobacter sp. YH12057 TaxID=2601057 RepID=UPI0015D45869
MTNKFIDHLISLLGKSNFDEKLVDFFVKNQFVKSQEEIKLPIYDEDGDLLDEYNFYISKYDEGLGFIFTNIKIIDRKSTRSEEHTTDESRMAGWGCDGGGGG